jgi:hypothetical protein
LQAMKVDVPADMKCKDKFLLQSTTIENEATEASLSDLVFFPIKIHPANLVQVDTNRERRHGGETSKRLDSTKENQVCMGSSSGRKRSRRTQGNPISDGIIILTNAIVTRTCPRRHTRQIKWRLDGRNNPTSITTPTSSNVLHPVRRPSRRPRRHTS